MLVLAHGTFDLFHYGHLKYLEYGSSLGELVVSVTADKYVNKGPGRPIFNENERAEILRALRCVSQVEVCHAKTAIPMIEKYRPDIYLKGADYNTQDKHGNLAAERVLVEALGGRLVIAETPLGSSTSLIERVREFSRAGQEG